MMSALFREKGATLDLQLLASDEAQHFINTHASTLDKAFERVPMSDRMRQRLQRSDYIFSGIKTFHELNEAFPSLLDENGDRKPFEQFLNDVQKIDKTYNRHYLEAEYNFVNASAQMAAKWETYAEDGDRYNLQYRTAGDDKVRPEHAALNGVTLPQSDPFWETYYPPNGWNCRCTVVQVRKSKYATTPREEAMARGEEALQSDTKGIFRFNSGKQEKAIPDYNAYTIKRCRDCDVAKGKANIAKPLDNELCQACILIHKAQKEREKKDLEKAEFNKLVTTANQWADDYLPKVMYNGRLSRRAYAETKDHHNIAIGKKFFGEIASDNKHNPELAHLLKTATEFDKWMPLAEWIKKEKGIHSKCWFSVYRVTYLGETFIFKCKMLKEETIYTMRNV